MLYSLYELGHLSVAAWRIDDMMQSAQVMAAAAWSLLHGG